MYAYPALLRDNKEGGYIVSFRDVPEAITEIWSMDEFTGYGCGCSGDSVGNVF